MTYQELTSNFWEDAPFRDGFSPLYATVYMALLHISKQERTGELVDINGMLIAYTKIPRKTLTAALTWLSENDIIGYVKGKNANCKPIIRLFPDVLKRPSSTQVETMYVTSEVQVDDKWGTSSVHQPEKMTEKSPPYNPPIEKNNNYSSAKALTTEEAEAAIADDENVKPLVSLTYLIDQYRQGNPGKYPEAFYAGCIDYFDRQSTHYPQKKIWQVLSRDTDPSLWLAGVLTERWQQHGHKYQAKATGTYAGQQYYPQPYQKTSVPDWHEFK